MRRRRRQRPGLLTTMGIISIVLGGLGLGCSIFGIGANVMASSTRKSSARVYDPGAAQLAALDRDAPNWQRAEIAHDVVVIVLAVLLIAAGIGLLKQQNWARWLAVATAVGCIVVRLAYGL